MSTTQIKTEIAGPHATMVLSTEGGLNVMSSALLKSLQAEIDKIAKNENVRTVALLGEGKVFAAGADIKEMADFNPDQALGYARFGQQVLDALEALHCVTVAGLNGPALGGGLELALACDFRIAVKSARIGLPETSLGLIPGWSGIRRLTRLIGPSQAKKLYLSSLPISAEDGAMIGLVDEAVNSPEDVYARVNAFCRSFRRAAPAAVGLAKRAFRTGEDAAAFADCFGTQDAREGISAFLEKRTAAWME